SQQAGTGRLGSAAAGPRGPSAAPPPSGDRLVILPGRGRVAQLRAGRQQLRGEAIRPGGPRPQPGARGALLDRAQPGQRIRPEVRMSSARSTPTGPISTDGPPPRRRVALVVDDDPEFRESLALLVRREGFDVEEAPTLAEARS